MTVGSFTSYFQQSMCVLIFLSFQVPTSVYFLLSTSPVLHDQNTRRLGFVFSVSEIGKILPIREFRRISLSPICCLEDRIMAMTFGGIVSSIRLYNLAIQPIHHLYLAHHSQSIHLRFFF